MNASVASKHANDWEGYVEAVGKHMPVHQESRDYGKSTMTISAQSATPPESYKALS